MPTASHYERVSRLEFAFLKQKPAQSSAAYTAEAAAAAATESCSSQTNRRQIRLPAAPALAVRKTLTPLPSAPRHFAPQTQPAQSTDTQQALPLRPLPSAAPAWKQIARDSPVATVATEKAAAPLKVRLASLVKTPVPADQDNQKHVAGVFPAHSAGCQPLSSAQQAAASGSVHQTEQASHRNPLTAP